MYSGREVIAFSLEEDIEGEGNDSVEEKFFQVLGKTMAMTNEEHHVEYLIKWLERMERDLLMMANHFKDLQEIAKNRSSPEEAVSSVLQYMAGYAEGRDVLEKD